MSFRRELRALRYVQQGDVIRLKSYIRRHRHLQLDKPLPGGQSLLHAACSLHDDACVLLLLRKGADPMQSDAAGNNALHVAAREMEKGEWRVYTDLVVPILKRCPQSIDAPNHLGTTPRHILKRAEDLMQRNSQQNVSAPKSHTDLRSTEWREKLMAESMDEYQELYGQYEDDYSDPVPEMETFESWAERIYKEYQARRCQSERPRSKTKVASAPETSRVVAAQKYQERRQQMEKELRQTQNERYQRRCQEVFQGTGAPGMEHGNNRAKVTEGDADVRTGIRLLAYSDIPWPLPGGTAEKMAQAIAAGADSSDVTSYKRYLRAQRVTWHPDRFMQRCGTRLLAKDRERVLQTVTALSQELNRLAELAK